MPTSDPCILAREIERAARRVGRSRATLFALSGIDASGKGTLARRLAVLLADLSLSVAVVGIDPWHTPQTIRLAGSEPAERFYRCAFRWDELFDELVSPLVRERSLSLHARLIRTDRDEWYDHQYRFDDVDVLLLEGIFLLKRELRWRYDLTCWIECSFETALGRAVGRNQEGLPADRIVSDYERIYFPAQQIHMERDTPESAADLIYLNDDRPARYASA